jgi:ATP-dependent helicase HrpA
VAASQLNPSQEHKAQLQTLTEQLPDARACDRPAMSKRLEGLARRLHRGQPVDRGLATLAPQLAASVAERKRRLQQNIQIDYPESLPVSGRVEEIARALRQHQVVIVAGETGSGKTTQLPKVLLQAGYGVDGDIVCTQPRRIAARSMAARLAEETQTALGELVGYQVRFDDQRSERTRVCMMTDGMLLAGLARDKSLNGIDALIIDEAHERSLNIDFLLGYLPQLLDRRPEMRLLVTSATIDTERFSKHFADAPVISVSGRSYPVEVRYRPPGDRDMPEAVQLALEELDSQHQRGDVLVFLPTERAIVDVTRHLERHYQSEAELLPLYGRLSASRQQKVFHPGAKRRVVLATNIAETSLTVPRIHSVVDTGLARMARYSTRSKVQRLPIEPISQAAANQRKGRCGRLGPGVCIRLYAEDDFALRPEYTEPEIQRSSLAAVILRMQDLGLGAVEDFPFLDAPARRQISDGYRLLEELDALDERRRITAVGKEIARFPVDVRIARILVAARDLDCLAPMLVIAAAMSVPDIRESEVSDPEAATELRKAIVDPQSDFMTWLRLWLAVSEQGSQRSGNQLRRWMREVGLHWVRWLEWRDVYGQLRRYCQELSWSPAGRLPALEEIDAQRIHQALLQGLLGNIGQRHEGVEYEGARARGFVLSPASALRKRPAKWLLAAELIETHRVQAHVAAAVQPEWIERAAGDRLRRTYGDVHWQLRSGRVMAREQVSLYGLVLANGRRVHYGPIEPAVARRLLIEHALVSGEADLDEAFLRHNRQLVKDITYLEAKQRRHDLLRDDSDLADFYDQYLPQAVFTVKALKSWLGRGGQALQEQLKMSRGDVLRDDVDADLAMYPDQLQVDGQSLEVRYRFHRGAEDDGMSLQVPLAMLNRLNPARLEWLVPGMLEEKVTALIRGLPKRLRRHFVPVPDFARAFMQAVQASDQYLFPVLSDQLHRMTGVSVAAEDWQAVTLEPHLLARVVLLDERGVVVEASRDLLALQGKHGQRARAHFRQHLGSGFHRDDLRAWDFGELPLQVDAGGSPAYPALTCDNGGTVGLRLFETPGRAEQSMRRGLAGLLARALTDKCRYLRRELMPSADVQLAFARLGGPQQLRDDCLQAALLETVRQFAEPVQDEAAFQALCQFARQQLGPTAQQRADLRDEVVRLAHKVHAGLSDVAQRWPRAGEDLTQQLEALLSSDFQRRHPAERLSRLPVYLSAMQHRIERLSADPRRDARQMDALAPLLQRLTAAQQTVRERPPGLQQAGVALEEVVWRVEELRVGLFAQHLGAAEKVSVKRLDSEIDSALAL